MGAPIDISRVTSLRKQPQSVQLPVTVNDEDKYRKRKRQGGTLSSLGTATASFGALTIIGIIYLSLSALRGGRIELPTDGSIATAAHAPGKAHESRVHNFIDSTGCSTNFFLAWTTSAESFSLRYRRTIESTLAYHPTACIIVYSPTLPMDYFQRFWDLGYNIIVERPNVAYLLRGTPAEVWLKNIEEWKKGPYFFSHITEIIRLASLYKYGGVYLDTDVIVMRELDTLRNCLGTELAGNRGEAKILNGAVLIFDKGSPFIWEGMVEFNTTYRIDSWGWNGPELVTRVAGRFPRGPELRILPTIGFYPIHWAKVKKYFTLEDMDEQHRMWDKMMQGTYLFHYWNKVTKDLVPEKGSLMYKVLNNYCIFCDETGRDG